MSENDPYTFEWLLLGHPVVDHGCSATTLTGMELRAEPERRLESSYPFIHDLNSQFRDMDPLGHVNNVVLAAYYEDARVHFLATRWGGGRRRADAPYALVASTTIDYLGEALHPRPYRIGVGVNRIGTSSVVISQALFQNNVCLGLCDATLVNMLNGRPTPLSDERRDALAVSFTTFTRAASN
jgi:acyl-CoA thioester hydrolase